MPIRALLLGVSAFAALPAFAQGSASSSEGLEDIVVTAQKRAQNLQDVPMSIVAVTGDALTQTGIVSIEGLNNKIPNAVIEPVGLFPGVASLSMRGVGVSGIESFADPQVAVYINGIYQARNVNALSSTVDVESIEVLRGPQGTLYGRNAFAGAISLRTTRPNMSETTGKAILTIGNYGRIDADFIGNVPLVEDRLAARLAVRTHNSDGFFKNHGVTANGTVDPNLEGRAIGRDQSLYVRPTLRFTPNDSWDITLFGEVFRGRGEAYNTGYAILSGSTMAGLGFPGRNPFGDASRGLPSDGSNPQYTGTNGGGQPADNDAWNLTADIAYTTDIGTIRALLNTNRATSHIWTDTDGTNVNAYSTVRWETYRATSAELQYVSDFSDKLNLIAGAFFLRDHYNTTQLSFTDFTLPFVPEFTIADPAQNPGYINNTGKRVTWAAYLQAEYNLTDKLALVLGGRYSWEKKYDVRGQNFVFSLTGLPRDTDFSEHPFSADESLVFGPAEQSWDSFSPRVGVNYHVNDDLMLFAFWQRAFKSGGFNANSSDLVAFNTPFGQERVDNYEAGFRSEWLDRKLRLNVNFFYSKFKGLQRSLVTPTPSSPNGVTTVNQNLADMKSYGVEAEILARPAERLTLFANIGWNNAEYTSYCADLDGAEATTTPANGRKVCGDITEVTTGDVTRYLVPTDFSDLRPIRAPKWDVTVGSTVDLPVSDSGTLEWNSSINYRSGMFVQLLNVPYSWRRPMATLDTSLRWEPENGVYDVSLWVKNLTNRIDILNYLPVGNLFASYHITPPRTFGATVSLKF
ncbi:TonB-dependent receptor [Sandaracinobacter sp. RS1-74]|uniref:TonB-dependent receptor n=1 Tax=Sandaracinobacteroides sayramensis TaxID=2913411 RepID=UPI001EDB2C26|nr:TonB-dependent receptor [Sandaracinobacteroides sayramensis]MCG2841133.1 TonB-dependent receptor [Sandaracinobacteroides sayramensis]